MPPLQKLKQEQEATSPRRHRVVVLRDGGGEDFPFVMRPDGVPALLPHLWLTFIRAERKQYRTLESYARTLAMFEDWSSQQGINLPQRCGLGPDFTDEEVGDLANHLRTISPGGLAMRRHSNARQRYLWVSGQYRPEQTNERNAENVCVATANYRFTIICDYLGWLDKKLKEILRKADPNHKHKAVLPNLAAKLRKNIIPVRASRREGLHDKQHHALLASVLPGTEEKPSTSAVFRPNVVHRNFAFITLLASTGLRVSEALCLKLNDVVRDGGEVDVKVERRPNENTDKRKRRPSVKTLGRTLRLAPLAAIALTDWLDKHREDQSRFGDSKDCPYLFLASIPKGSRRPAVALSLGAADKIFRSIRERVADIGLDVTAHRLRHSWMDHIWKILAKAGRQDPIVQDMINYAGGWRPGSNQSKEYAQRAIRESANELALIFQEKLTKDLDKPQAPVEDAQLDLFLDIPNERKRRQRLDPSSSRIQQPSNRAPVLPARRIHLTEGLPRGLLRGSRQPQDLPALFRSHVRRSCRPFQQRANRSQPDCRILHRLRTASPHRIPGSLLRVPSPLWRPAGQSQLPPSSLQ